jgi:hypothetical protein
MLRERAFNACDYLGCRHARPAIWPLPAGAAESSVPRLIDHREFAMYVRVVRFASVSAERMESMLVRIKEAGGPPPGVESTGITVLFDESQGTAVVLQRYATAAAMEEASKIFEAMDAGETPGNRVSVDACEMKLDLEA